MKKQKGCYRHMAKSLFSLKKECWVCQNPHVDEHHIFGSVSDRPVSELLGFKVYLCRNHHQELHMHPNKGMDLTLKILAQKYYEENYGSRDDFRSTFRKSYL